VTWENEDRPAISYDFFAVDWQGNMIKDCPLEPYFDQLYPGSEHSTAGYQGPSYFWVELNGQRGYIDTLGNWLFIDPTEYNEPS